MFLENYNHYNHRPERWVGGERAMETPTNSTDEDEEGQQGHVDGVHHTFWRHRWRDLISNPVFAFLWLHCFHLKLRTDEDDEGQQGHVDDVHHSWGHCQGSILPSTALVENIGFQTHCLLFFGDGIFIWNFAVPVLPRMIYGELNVIATNTMLRFSSHLDDDLALTIVQQRERIR